MLPHWLKKVLVILGLLLFSPPNSTLQSQSGGTPSGVLLPTVLYGAAYYHEYMPSDLQPGRLEKDVALMREAGITVVRMGESTWSLWEPEDGKRASR
jgi:beta-galactosidase